MTHQTGILEAPPPARYFLEYRVRAPIAADRLVAALRAACAPGDDVDRLVAFGPAVAAALDCGVDLPGFEAITGSGQTAPATQRDLLVVVQGARHDQVFDGVLSMRRHLEPLADVELELRGFDYHSSRDLIGFEDGTGNPKADKALTAATIPEGEPGAAGAFVMTQQWVHDLDAFARLPTEEQERVIGRTKADSIEFEGDAMPPDSHVARTDVSVDGTAMKILRRSSPYGSARVHGLYFLAFACELRRFRVQLDRMYGVSGDGLSDRLLGFSRAVSGSYWFAPSAEGLARIFAD